MFLQEDDIDEGDATDYEDDTSANGAVSISAKEDPQGGSGLRICCGCSIVKNMVVGSEVWLPERDKHPDHGSCLPSTAAAAAAACHAGSMVHLRGLPSTFTADHVG